SFFPIEHSSSLKKSDTFDCTVRQRSDLIEFSYLNDSDLIYFPEIQASEEPAASFPQRHFSRSTTIYDRQASPYSRQHSSPPADTARCIPSIQCSRSKTQLVLV